MKLKRSRAWHTEPDREGLLFFAQKLDELYFDYTLDTYKPPALTCFYLALEAIELIDDIDNNLIEEKNLSFVLDEFEWSLSKDPIIKSLVEAPLKYFLLRGDGVKLSETKIRLEAFLHSVNPLVYLETCHKLLKNAITNIEKNKIVELSRLYSSSLINHGISKQNLWEKTQSFFFYGDDDLTVDAVDEYFESVSPTGHDFEVYFLVSDMIEHFREHLVPFSLEVIESLPQAAASCALEAGLVPDQDEVWVEVKHISTYDRHAARREAEQHLETLRDLMLLYSHKEELTWRHETVITQCCEEIPILIKAPKNSMEKCFDQRVDKAPDSLGFFTEGIKLKDNSLRKFLQAVDLHAVATTNEKPENQLLNVWIALETIVPSFVKGGSKVSKVCNGITPILTKAYIRRILETLAGDLIRWSRQTTSKILRQIQTPNNTLYERLLSLVVLDENEELRGDLYASLNEYPLLKNRIYEVSQLLRSPLNVLQRIELHEKKVSWQLRRIYRTRNLIVHSGRSPDFLDTLIENAHDYLDQVMSAVVKYSCGHHMASSMEQVFDLAYIDSVVYTKKLKSLEEFDTENVYFLIKQ